MTAEVRRAATLIDTGLRAFPAPPHAVLIGDAAHAMLQYLGQGACQALGDALELGAALARYPGDRGSAFKAYEQARLPVASRCQTAARPWGALWHTDDPTLVALRNRVFRIRNARDYSDLDWLYAERETILRPALH